VNFLFFLFNLNIYLNLDLNNDGIYIHFIDNNQTLNHQSIIYGIRELNLIEMKEFCLNKTFHKHPPMINEPFHFTSNYQIRIYQSGCFYLDSNNYWQSDGLLVNVLH